MFDLNHILIIIKLLPLINLSSQKNDIIYSKNGIDIAVNILILL